MRSKLRTHAELPVLKDEAGALYKDDAQKAEALAAYFASAFTSRSEELPSELDSYLTQPGDAVRMDIESICEIVIQPADVLRVMKQLKPSTSATFDGIPQIVFKRCAHSLYKPLAMIFNTSLMYKEVPEIWKESIITAIPKKPNSVLLSSFRPISITPTPIKIMEKILRERIMGHLSRNRLIPFEQHGFTAGASTVTQLSDCVFDWNFASNNGNSVDVIYFDLSKAFDKVCHEKLVTKLYHLGIRQPLLGWIHSYLNGRHMRVKVGNSFSRSYDCKSGVPQGGVLSPILFLVYTCDPPAALTVDPHVKVQMYADDIKIYGTYNNGNKAQVCHALSQSVNVMMEWAKAWQIPVNISKTSVLHIGTSDNVEYKFNNCALSSVPEVRDLGILMDSRLNFENHINTIVRKAFSTLFLICRNVKCTDSTILVNLYKTYVVPVLEYSSQVWSPFTKKSQSKLEKVQKTFTKILYHRCIRDPSDAGTVPSYKERLALFNLKSLFYRRIFNDLVFCYKLLKGELRLRASKYWVFLPTLGHRNAYRFRHPKVKKKIVKSLQLHFLSGCSVVANAAPKSA